MLIQGKYRNTVNISAEIKLIETLKSNHKQAFPEIDIQDFQGIH